MKAFCEEVGLPRTIPGWDGAQSEYPAWFVVVEGVRYHAPSLDPYVSLDAAKKAVSEAVVLHQSRAKNGETSDVLFSREARGEWEARRSDNEEGDNAGEESLQGFNDL